MAFVEGGWTPAGNSRGIMALHTYINLGRTLAQNVTEMSAAVEVSEKVQVGDVILQTGSDGTKFHTVDTIVARGEITLTSGLVITDA